MQLELFIAEHRSTVAFAMLQGVLLLACVLGLLYAFASWCDWLWTRLK